ncbi:hypothetical protein AB3N61_18485 [Leptospira sp. WS58.C1]|uniref:hypothetical protein n=1 Tax=Leptospira cinconiae TaxID=3235173 RepID=UPI00349EB864
MKIYILFLSLIALINCDGFIRGNQRVFIKEGANTYKAYSGICIVRLYFASNYDKGKEYLKEETVLAVDGYISYSFTVPPVRERYKAEIKCKSDKIISVTDYSIPDEPETNVDRTLIIGNK